MQFYRMTSDPTTKGNFRWDWIEYLPDQKPPAEFHIPLTLFQPGPKAACWRPFRVRLRRERATGDFFFLADCWPAVNPRAWAAVRDVVGSSAEVLPLDLESGEELLLLNVLDRVPLAEGAGVSRDATGRLHWVYRFAFREQDVADKVIFKACESTAPSSSHSLANSAQMRFMIPPGTRLGTSRGRYSWGRTCAAGAPTGNLNACER
jgi:hypothetical protein